MKKQMEPSITKCFNVWVKKNDQLYEAELVKSEFEHKEPTSNGSFILQYAKLRMLELYYNFFEKFCNVEKFDELEMDTGLLYLHYPSTICKIASDQQWKKCAPLCGVQSVRMNF